MPRIEKRQAHLAVLIQIWIKSRLAVIREIVELGRLEWIIVREMHLKAERAAVIRRSFGPTDHGPSVCYIALILHPEES
jgi:hypothetical protein